MTRRLPHPLARERGSGPAGDRTRDHHRRARGALLACAGCLLVAAVLPPGEADAGWQSGWPGQPWTHDGARVAGDGALLTMRLRGGRTENVPAVRWDRTLHPPAPGRAWCVTLDAWWSGTPGAVATLWLRPADRWAFPGDFHPPVTPELDLFERLGVRDVSIFSHPVDRRLEPGELARWPAGPGMWHRFGFRIARDRFFAGWVEGQRLMSGPVWWPDAGYTLVAGLWAITAEQRFAAWPQEHKVPARFDGDAHEWLRDVDVRECAA